MIEVDEGSRGAEEFKGVLKYYTNANTIINNHANGILEVIKYKRTFKVLSEQVGTDDIDRERLLKLEDGVLVKARDEIEISQIQRSIRNSNKRALDTFHGYAMSNIWDYFLTLTFSPDVVDRNDDIAVKALWGKFQDNCKKKHPNVNIICVPERHKPCAKYPNGALHFHALVAGVKFNLLPQYGKNNEALFFQNGTQKYGLVDWEYGFSQVAVIPKDDNYLKLSFYLAKYITKDGNIGYNQKRYYRTRNLAFKEKGIFNLNNDIIEDLVKCNNLEKIKDNARFTVYRTCINPKAKPAKQLLKDDEMKVFNYLTEVVGREKDILDVIFEI